MTQDFALAGELLKAVGTAVSGALLAYYSSTLKLREQGAEFSKQLGQLRERMRLERDEARQQATETAQQQYLNPLRFAVYELLDRLHMVEEKIAIPDDYQSMQRWFQGIEQRTRDKPAFDRWCNDEGYFAMVTLYITATYFEYACKLLPESPFRALDQAYDDVLVQLVRRVRDAFSGIDFIWRESQDDVAHIVSRDGKVISYMEFRELVTVKYPWFLRMVRAYGDIRREHVSRVSAALSELRAFLEGRAS